jgi:hypothetical protein
MYIHNAFQPDILCIIAYTNVVSLSLLSEDIHSHSPAIDLFRWALAMQRASYVSYCITFAQVYRCIRREWGLNLPALTYHTDFGMELQQRQELPRSGGLPGCVIGQPASAFPFSA